METKNPKRNRTKQSDGASKDAAKSRGKRGSISAKELALLAAIISPEECKNGGAGSALRFALNLLIESENVLQSYDASQRSRDAFFQFAGDTAGGDRLFKTVSAQMSAEDNRPLRLNAGKSSDSDEVRDYLAQNCNFEGNKENKAWGKVRTVWDNFRAMFITEANEHNERNKDRIIAAEKRAAELDAANPDGGTLPPRQLSDDEKWDDGETEFERFKSDATRYFPRIEQTENPKISHYEISTWEINNLIRWKRKIKSKGGIKAVKFRTREDVLGTVKKLNPKKKK